MTFITQYWCDLVVSLSLLFHTCYLSLRLFFTLHSLVNIIYKHYTLWATSLMELSPSGSLPFVSFVVCINIVIILFWRINLLASLLVLS